MQYGAIFKARRNDVLDVLDENILYFSYFCSKHRLCARVRTAARTTSMGQF